VALRSSLRRPAIPSEGYDASWKKIDSDGRHSSFRELVHGLGAVCALAQAGTAAAPQVRSDLPRQRSAAGPSSARYQQVQHRLAQGWNTWDVNSVTTQVLLPEGWRFMSASSTTPR